jgi:hypothetical protein
LFCAFCLGRTPPPGLLQSAIRNPQSAIVGLRHKLGLFCAFCLGRTPPAGRNWVRFARFTPRPRHAPDNDALCPHTPVSPSLASFCTNRHHRGTEGTEAEPGRPRPRGGDLLCDLGVSVVNSSYLAEEQGAALHRSRPTRAARTPRVIATIPDSVFQSAIRNRQSAILSAVAPFL